MLDDRLFLQHSFKLKLHTYFMLLCATAGLEFATCIEYVYCLLRAQRRTFVVDPRHIEKAKYRSKRFGLAFKLC